MSWQVLEDPPEVMPLGDLFLHDRGKNCRCSPREEDGVLIHNSFDRRELTEEGKVT